MGKKLVYGVGINDADYPVSNQVTINGTRKVIWRCPFYIMWTNMLKRCYSDNYLSQRPTYVGCCVCSGWIYFSNFRSWADSQDWQGKQLDKDLLIVGNKVYSPETCVFVSAKTNSFLTECDSMRGGLPIGVSKEWNKFKAMCGSVDGCRLYFGLFSTPEEAHAAWLAAKLEQAYILAAEQTDERVAKALINRYENYKLERE